MTDCIFCKIGAGQVPSQFLHRDDRVFVIRDIYPKAPVHLLIIPLEHVGALTGEAHEREGLLGHMMAVAAAMARQEEVAGSGYRLLVNQGPDSGQEVPHLHLHLLGGHRLRAMG